MVQVKTLPNRFRLYAVSSYYCMEHDDALDNAWGNGLDSVQLLTVSMWIATVKTNVSTLLHITMVAAKTRGA